MKNMFKSTAFLVLAVSIAMPAFANEGMDHGKKLDEMREHAAVMRQAAAELKGTNPDLSKKLDGFADQKEKKVAKWAEKKDKMGDMRAKHAEKHAKNVTLLRSASNELKASNPTLSKELSDFADEKEKMMKEKAEKYGEDDKD